MTTIQIAALIVLALPAAVGAWWVGYRYWWTPDRRSAGTGAAGVGARRGGVGTRPTTAARSTRSEPATTPSVGVGSTRSRRVLVAAVATVVILVALRVRSRRARAKRQKK